MGNFLRIILPGIDVRNREAYSVGESNLLILLSQLSGYTPATGVLTDQLNEFLNATPTAHKPLATNSK